MPENDGAASHRLKTIMVNPFDKSFFKFLIGFACILLLSFVVLYLVGNYIH